MRATVFRSLSVMDFFSFFVNEHGKFVGVFRILLDEQDKSCCRQLLFAAPV